MKVLGLKKRKDFIRAAKEFKVVVNGMVLQAALNLLSPNEDCCFVGYTATKKLGKAYLRNRTKRRLRAAAREILPALGLKGINYVFIGRHNTATLKFDYLVRRMKEAVTEINQQINSREITDDKKVNDSAD